LFNFADLKSVKELEITSIRKTGSDDSGEQQVYTLEVRGKNNYQVLSKIRDALEFQQKFVQASYQQPTTDNKILKKQSTLHYDNLPNVNTNATTKATQGVFDPNDSIEK
jgi:hypothetical protein